MKLFWLMILCFCFCLPAHAQWQKQVLPALSKKGLSSHIFSSIERKVLPARYQARIANQATVKFVRNYHPEMGSLDDNVGSAFIIKENTQGTPRVWGVTVQHYDFSSRPAIEHPSFENGFPIQLQAAGHSRYSDVVLFSVPLQVAEKLTPLKLAGALPKPGEEVNSYGYYNGGFQQLRHRLIKAVTPARMVTSYEFSSDNRIGACGGPVLNVENEVVGVHCGSSLDLKNSFVVPVTHIYRLLDAYYHQNKNTETLFFNGQKMYELTVNQALSRAVALRKGYPVEDVTLRSYNVLLNPAHVEKLFFTPDPDGILLYIDQTDFTTNKALPSFQIFYNIKTGEITLKNQ